MLRGSRNPTEPTTQLLIPDHKTIADFRKDSGPGISQVKPEKNRPTLHLAKCFDTAKTHGGH
jgi:hypothetical protein